MVLRGCVGPQHLHETRAVLPLPAGSSPGRWKPWRYAPQSEVHWAIVRLMPSSASPWAKSEGECHVRSVSYRSITLAVIFAMAGAVLIMGCTATGSATRGGLANTSVPRVVVLRSP